MAWFGCTKFLTLLWHFLWNSSKAEVNAAVGDIGLTWCMLHFFSFPTGEDMTTVLSLSIFNTLWSARYLGWKVYAVWFLINTGCPIFISDALLNFLSCTGYLVIK